MSEPVIDIRDRIEKMRNQMSVPEGVSNPGSTTKSPLNSELKKQNINVKNKDKVNDNVEVISKVKETEKLSDDIIQKKKDFKNNFDRTESLTKVQIERIEKKSDFDSNNFNTHSTTKKDKVNKNDNQSIKLDEETTFPQFSLNVSNPISWKLMLLIMVMQLLTNIMLVVVLYLK